MSIQTSLDLKLVNKNYDKLELLEVLIILEMKNWSMQKNGETLFLPIDDDGDYNWTKDRLTLVELENIISNKVDNKETIGIALYHEVDSVGVEVLYFSEGYLSFLLSTNVKYLFTSRDGRIVDANWYIKELVAPLLEKFYCEKISFEQLGC